MSSQNVKVVGVPATPGPNGSLPLRREIRDLEANFPDQFNLYILGLRALQARSKDDPTSYYQIAGIHGMPYKVWNNANGIQDFQFGGYCTHSSILFITWHRPYLALFEQALYSAIQEEAAKFPPELRSRYTEAAKLVRLPYFDWAVRVRLGADSLPPSIASQTIRVVDTDGKQKSIDNPLYSFNISQVRPNTGDLTRGWQNRPRTVRHPDSRGNSRNGIIEQELDNESASLRQEVSLLLLSYTDYDDFSNSTWRRGTTGRPLTSLESVHDDIHGRTGGSGGHMSSLDVSAMDPIFWLHHCNVDRLWNIWQDLNPDEFMTARPAPFSNFTVRGGTLEDARTPLSPFWDASGSKFWTSEAVKSPAAFGYAYPETQKWGFASTAAYQRELRRTIARLYGSNPFLNFAQTIAPVDRAADRPTLEELAADPGARIATRSLAAGVRLAAVSPKEEQKPVAAEQKAAAAEKQEEGRPDNEAPPQNPIQKGDLTAPIPDSLAYLCPDNQYTDWIVNVRTLKHGLPQTFRIIIFLGDFSPEPSNWEGNAEYNTVGRVTVLGRPGDTPCARCQADQENELVVAGAVPLTSALLQDITAGKLASLEVADVVPYLKRNLHWRVALFTGESYPVEQVPGLKVSVCSSKVRIGEDGIPSYSGEYTTHTEVTAGRVGGLGEDDEY
ncbi:related to Tyrosinase [Cephalotrichum gorgonifer]|uniref:tyrosinase n=1 Tax=Cephalotrichum gorgonifer TaxID=2041049 RepID=A0AAE8MND4_9PEZI|nr:related to Tyrosinase [Cephalotrichum gorgonifer]